MNAKKQKTSATPADATDDKPKQSMQNPTCMCESVEFIYSPLGPSTSANTATDNKPKRSTQKPKRMRESVEFIRSPLASSTSGNVATTNALDPDDDNDDDDNIPIDRRRPLLLATLAQRAAGHILPATRKCDIPDFSVYSQNICYASIGPTEYRPSRGVQGGERQSREGSVRKDKLLIVSAALKRGAHELNSSHDFAFLQEINTSISPVNLLQNEISEYLAFAGVPRGGDRLYDTAVLVSKRFNSAQLETEASCRRATFVTVSEVGLLLVAIHGPFIDVQTFHHDVISTVVLYQEAGWTPIIAGDFNLAPTPADRRGEITRAEKGLMSLYTELLNLCNVCEVLTDLNNPRSTVDRSTYFTFKGRSGTCSTYVSRIDHILVPLHLLDMKRAKYGHKNVNDKFSDHREISLYAPQTPPGKFFSRAAFRMSHNFSSDPVHLVKIEQIFGEFDFTLTGHAAFEKYQKLLSDILQYACNQNNQRQNHLEREILRLHKERMELGSEHNGQGWSIHQDRIHVLKERAVALAKTAAIDVQERVAQTWFKKGDRDSFWQSLITKRHMHPRRMRAIVALQYKLPAGFSTSNRNPANNLSTSFYPPSPTIPSYTPQQIHEMDTEEYALSSADGLLAAAEYYLGTVYEHEEPFQQSKKLLVDSMYRNIAARHCALTEAEIQAMPRGFSLIDIINACNKAVLRKEAGPNGIPAEFYIASKTARKILCHLGNIWIRDPDSVPAFFAEGSITLVYKKGDRTLLDNYRPISVLNADLKILTSIVAERIGGLVHRLVSREQFAIIPGRFIADGIYNMQTFAKYLEVTGNRGAMVFLDQAKAFDRVSHTTLFAVLDRIGIPAVYIAAIKALYKIATSRVMVNGQPSKAFPIRRGVRQGDALSRVLFVIVTELLGCAIRDNLPEEAKLNIPGANSSHVMYMDKTVVMLCSLKYWPDLKRGLDIYCRATTANFNFTNTEFVPFNHRPGEIPHDLPASPVPSGTPIHYFGTSFGCNVSINTRRALSEELIAKIVAVGRRAVQAHKTIEGRAYALSTFVFPRFSLAFQFEDFTLGQIKRADAALHRLMWNPINSFLRPKLAARPVQMGGFGVPTLRAIFEATKLKMIACYAEHIRRAYGMDPPSNDHRPIPEWSLMLGLLWRYNMQRYKEKFPGPLRMLMCDFRTQIFFDPLVQADGFARVPEGAWPPVWHDAYKVLYDKTGSGTGELANLLREVTCRLKGNPLTQPLLMTGHFKVKGTFMWTVFAQALLHLFIIEDYNGLVTVNEIPDIVRIIMLPCIGSPSPTVKARLADTLECYFSTLVQETAGVSKQTWSRSYQYNMAYGTVAQAVNVTALPFEQWMNMRVTQNFIEHDDKRLIFPSFRVQDPALTTACSSWLSITNLNAPPEIRSTIHRLALNRLPGRTPPECDCGVLDTVDHVLSVCHFFEEFRQQFLAHWLYIAHGIVGRVGREENINSITLSSYGLHDQSRQIISEEELRNQLPQTVPQLENWLALPFLRWKAYCDFTTPTAKHFNQCFELAASLFIHFLYVARNSLAYDRVRWTPRQFVLSFNSMFQRLANATLSCDLADQAKESDQAVLDNLLLPSANHQNRTNIQRSTETSYDPCYPHLREDEQPYFAQFVQSALLKMLPPQHELPAIELTDNARQSQPL